MERAGSRRTGLHRCRCASIIASSIGTRLEDSERRTGQVIEKQGRTARALRTILFAIAMKEKRRLEMDILTVSEPIPASQFGEDRDNPLGPSQARH
jgi:predicted RNA-binding protein YlqC (UPF0109 family)